MAVRRIKKGETLAWIVKNVGTDPNGDVRVDVQLFKRRADGTSVDLLNDAPESVGLVLPEGEAESA